MRLASRRRKERMYPIDDRARRSTAALRRGGWLAGALLLTCCGGNVGVVQSSTVGGAAGNGRDAGGGSNSGSSGEGSSSSGTSAGGNDVATGGDTHDGGQNIQVGIGGMPGGVGGDMAAGAAGAPDMTSDSSQLLTAILRGALGGLGTCEFAASPAASDNLGPRRGAVVLDSMGRVIDNTGLPVTTKQAWLDQLMDRRWLCLAGQTLGYKCSAAG